MQAAKLFQQVRLQRVGEQWVKDRRLKAAGFDVDLSKLQSLLFQANLGVDVAHNHAELLTEEARLTKQLYKLASQATRYGDFTRGQRGMGTDIANQFLDHGNYLAYGLAATATWVLGLPHGLAVLHGKTRRGGLVFDVADLVKDAIILPQAFISAAQGNSEQEFRQACIESLTRSESLDFMIDTLKNVSIRMGQLTEQSTDRPIH